MAKEEKVSLNGTIVGIEKNFFRVELDAGGIVIATICGKMRQRQIRCTLGDKVIVELGAYDLTKGRITKRL